MPIQLISLQPWGYGTFYRCYKIIEVDRISKMIFCDEMIFYLVFALLGMRIIQLPFSSHGYPLSFGAMSLVFYQYFMAVLCIPAHIMSSQNSEPRLHSESETLASPDLLMANTFLTNEVPLFLLHLLHFDLLLLGFNEQELGEVRRIFVICILRSRELKVPMCVHAHVQGCVHVYVCTHVYLLMCTLCNLFTYVCVFLCTCEHAFVCVCTFIALYCTLQMSLEAFKDIVQV